LELVKRYDVVSDNTSQYLMIEIDNA